MTDKPRMALRDLFAEAVAGVTARPVRSALTTLGTMLGIATLVVTLGVAATAGNQITGRFDAVRATEVTVEVPQVADDGATADVVRWESVDDVARLNGVRAAASVTDLASQPKLVKANDINDPTKVAGQSLSVIGATVGLPDAIGAAILHGRMFDRGHVARADRVCVLGVDAAKTLGITRLDQVPAVFVDGRAFTVIGVLGPSTREPGLGAAVIVPYSTGQQVLQLGPVRTVLIRTDLGAAQLIGRQAPNALSPNDFRRLDVQTPPDPEQLRNQVKTDVNGLFLVLGLVSLVVGAVGIANVTLVTVLERTGEIGLRRSLGAARRHIGAQFLVESTIIGLLGGVVGASVGIVAVVGVALVQDWTPVLDHRLVLAAPPAGALVGLLAGLYPALRAARLQPVDALRSGT